MRKLAIILAFELILVLQRSSSTVVKTSVFLSPEIVLEPGFVSNKNYYNIDFPRDHIALKGFTAELVDGAGNPVPLLETYLHHWVLQRYYTPIDNPVRNRGDYGLQRSNYSLVRNSGICDGGMTYYYGVGAETRRTSTDIPDPYGIHVGDPASVPAGMRRGLDIFT